MDFFFAQSWQTGASNTRADSMKPRCFGLERRRSGVLRGGKRSLARPKACSITTDRKIRSSLVFQDIRNLAIIIQ